jgi:hypothetical protein
LSAVGMIIPIEINKLGIFQLLFFPYFSLWFTILNSFYLERNFDYFGNRTRTVGVEGQCCTATPQ